MPTIGDAIRTREQADRAAKYESSWTIKLHAVPNPTRDAEEGIVAMRDIYSALTDQPIAAWQREPVIVDENYCSGEALGAPLGRGLMIRRCQYDDAGNPRDGWPRELTVATAGLPAMQVEVRLCSDMPLSRTSDRWTLDSPLAVAVRSNGGREPIRRAIVERFARLGYTEY